MSSVARPRIPDEIEDTLNRLIIAILLSIDPDISCTQSFLQQLRAMLHSHLTALTSLVSRSSVALASTNSPSARDWMRGLQYVQTNRAPYGLSYGHLHHYLRTRPPVDAAILPASQRNSGQPIPSTPSIGSAPGRFGSAAGRSYASRSESWGPSTEQWLDSEGEQEDEYEDEQEQPWEMYPSIASSSRNQVRPVNFSGHLFKPPKHHVPIFPPTANGGESHDDATGGGPHQQPGLELGVLLDPDASAPPPGSIPNRNPPPIHKQVDADGMLTKQALAYMRAVQGVIPAHLPALPPRHAWRRTPYYTGTIALSTPASTSAAATAKSEVSNRSISNRLNRSVLNSSHHNNSTSLVDRKLQAARLAQNSLRRLISATEEAAAKAAEKQMADREERARKVEEMRKNAGAVADTSMSIVPQAAAIAPRSY
ncbi:hypothetical protein OC846_002888 [Tilletia horrida]|uniref:Transcription factor TFIID subunit 8 C-terminal domain-containing protein n=1 Tax=Tilletia horrida TaxID=155126 RepID=A0AAN6GTK1_9BASI|nr:hypothetical protein OC845_002082 [Tilletia horrida]KAK0552484.1 hypothetical protein OC846_002888 [Tilletia horrida]KAK0561788.1 hypothetical protein OC861_005654 [Tilletia horrida]